MLRLLSNSPAIQRASQIALSISLLAMLTATTGLAKAPAQSSVESGSFRLKVVHTDTDLSGNGSHNGAGSANTYSSLSQDDLGNGLDARTSTIKGDANLPAYIGQAQTGTMDTPPGKKLDGTAEEAVSTGETGVDWSSWISTLADHWFDSLKNMEFRSQKGFQTKCPAVIRFTCHRTGEITGIRLLRSSGNPAYDAMQIEALKRITPLHPFPAGSKRDIYVLQLGWESHHTKSTDEKGFQKGTFGKSFPVEKVNQRHKIN